MRIENDSLKANLVEKDQSHKEKLSSLELDLVTAKAQIKELR